MSKINASITSPPRVLPIASVPKRHYRVAATASGFAATGAPVVGFAMTDPRPVRRRVPRPRGHRGIQVFPQPASRRDARDAASPRRPAARRSSWRRNFLPTKMSPRGFSGAVETGVARPARRKSADTREPPVSGALPLCDRRTRWPQAVHARVRTDARHRKDGASTTWSSTTAFASTSTRSPTTPPTPNRASATGTIGREPDRGRSRLVRSGAADVWPRYWSMRRRISTAPSGEACFIDDSCERLPNGVEVDEEVAAHAAEAEWWIAAFGADGKRFALRADYSENRSSWNICAERSRSAPMSPNSGATPVKAKTF